MDRSLPGFSIHQIFQARVLEWVAISFSNIYNKSNIEMDIQWKKKRIYKWPLIPWENVYNISYQVSANKTTMRALSRHKNNKN